MSVLSSFIRDLCFHTSGFHLSHYIFVLMSFGLIFLKGYQVWSFCIDCGFENSQNGCLGPLVLISPIDLCICVLMILLVKKYVCPRVVNRIVDHLEIHRSSRICECKIVEDSQTASYLMDESLGSNAQVLASSSIGVYHKISHCFFL